MSSFFEKIDLLIFFYWIILKQHLNLLFVCLFVCFQHLANYISENSKVKVRNVWNILSSCIMCYFFCRRSSSILCTVNKVVHVTAKIIWSSKHSRKKQYVVRRSEVKVWKMADKWHKYILLSMSLSICLK